MNNLDHFKNQARPNTLIKRKIHEPDLLYLREYSK